MSSIIDEGFCGTTRLSLSHRTSVLELLSREDLVRSSRRFLESGPASRELENGLNPEIREQILFGEFRNDRLVSILGIRLWRELPHFMCSGFVRAAGATLDGCFEEMLTYAWNQKLTQGYFFFPASHSEKHRQTGILESPRLRDCLFAIEAFVPRGCCPLFPAEWEVMGCRTYDFDGIIASLGLGTRARLEQLQ